MHDSTDGQEGWKRRYFDSLAEMELRERSWAEAERVLRQGLSRLSVAAEGIDPALDRQLQELRRLLREGRDADGLRAILAQVSELVRQLEDATGERAGAARAGLWGWFLGKGKGGTSAGTAEHGRARLGVVRNLLQELVEDLLGADNGADLIERIGQVESEGQAYSLGHELVMRLQTGGRVAPLSGAGLKPHEVLLRLLEHIEVPRDLGGRYEAIRQMLVGGAAAERTEQALAAMADLVAEIHGRAHRDRAEIESFLQQVTERLNEIDHAFEQSLARHRKGYEDGRALDRNVDLQVKGIEDSVSQARDLESLQVALQQRVDVIRTHLREFRETEEERIAEAERQVEQLNQRLQSVQEESEELRRRLKDERDLALVDPLTGIPNRFAYNERLQLEVARWRRYRSPLTLAVWDIDRFKDVNDRYGHQAGDKALTLIAQLIQRHIRETDFLARYGGEEFVLLLPETALKAAMVAAEHIRREVKACGFHYQGEPVPMTISCGMSEFREGDTAEVVFGRADAALYRAKAQGRNRCLGD